MTVITRFAPSPTGFFHAGSYRTAVFAYLFARHNKGTFMLRIEDTDRARSTKEYEDNIIETLTWLGLENDIFVRQSERVGEHERALRDLVQAGHAYVSKEKGEDGVERELIRFKNPGKSVTFTDAIRGDITFDTTDLKDFVIAKSFSEPLFHFVVVYDDAAAGVTHVIRGEDHISNTPRQMLIYEALGKPIPIYAHLPLVLAADRSKLSKRKGARPLLEYRAEGYLPEAILNYITMVGWNPGTDEELFTKAQLIERFDLAQVQKSGAVYDEVKLKWFNREHMLRLTDDEFLAQAKKFSDILEIVPALLPIIRERVSTFGEISEMEKAGEFEYFIKAPQVKPAELAWKKEPDLAKTGERLERSLSLLNAMGTSDWSVTSLRDALMPYAEEVGKGNVLWPLRYALTGKEKSPDPFTVAAILGKDETLKRITDARAGIGA